MKYELQGGSITSLSIVTPLQFFLLFFSLNNEVLQKKKAIELVYQSDKVSPYNCRRWKSSEGLLTTLKFFAIKSMIKNGKYN